MQLFFDRYITSGSYQLPENESKHFIRVLRKSVGDQVMITNGSGSLFQAVITNIKGKSCFTEVTLVEEIAEMSPKLIMAIAPTKAPIGWNGFLKKLLNSELARSIPFSLSIVKG